MDMACGPPKRSVCRAGQLRGHLQRTPAPGSLAQQPDVDRLWEYAIGVLWPDRGMAGRSQQIRACFQIVDLFADGDLVCGRQRDLELYVRSPA